MDPRLCLGLGLLLAAISLAGCQRTPRPAVAVALELPEAEDSWTQVASTGDAEKIGTIDTLWGEALAAARKAGFQRQIAAEGVLLDPGAALERPAPTPGFYTCRILRFGDPAVRQRVFAAFKPFFCYVGVRENRLALTKDGGSDRPGGYLWDDPGNDRRMIFLGAAALGAEKAPPGYGDRPERDVAGIVERIDDFHFRLLLPKPRSGSRLDVMELVAAP